MSKAITDKINHGDLSEKPGWVRWSLHPTMTNAEVELFLHALAEIVSDISSLEKDYLYVGKRNEYIHNSEVNRENQDKIVQEWFKLDMF